MYTRLIGGCGRVGYTKMAFKLYKEMRDRDMKMTPGTLTGLFNACAEGPFKEYSLEKAHNLYERMEFKGWTPSNITYHAMIKAFGKCGDIQTAFRVVDKMQSEKHAVTADTFAFLLMACISDREAGFALGLKVMRLMLWKKIRPSLYCYNLFLRTVRECGIGPAELFQDLLETTVPKKKLAGQRAISKKNKNMLAIVAEEKAENLGHVGAGEPCSHVTSDRESGDEERATSTPLENPENLPGMPNLLSPSLRVEREIVGLANVTEPYDRLLMCGGLKGVMDHFCDMDIHPDVKTVTLLLDCIPNTTEAEHELIAEADRTRVKLDVDFFNMLIKRRALRMQKSEAREVLTLIANRGLRPDVITFGVLALCICSDKQGKEFLATMKNARMTVNEEILSTLIGNACYRLDFFFLLTLMHFAINNGVRVNPSALQRIEEAKQRARKAIMDNERGIEAKYKITEYAEKGYTKFCLHYEEWLKEVAVDLPQHPWEQYKPENALKTRREFLEEAEKAGRV
uniref:Putative pentatricopeptide repeat protein n=1 Tax=Ornithodoros turicata TaxID=34597 RepID=A0A2R5LI41_9ACAR